MYKLPQDLKSIMYIAIRIGGNTLQLAITFQNQEIAINCKLKSFSMKNCQLK